MNVAGHLVTAAGAAVLGFVAGYFLQASDGAANPASVPAPVAHGQIVAEPSAPAVARDPAAVPARADAEETVAEVRPAEPAAVAAERPSRDRRDWRAERERLRAEEPERFARMTNFIARAHAARIARNQTRRDWLAQVDATDMTDAERQTHETLKALLAQQAELDEALRDENLSEDDRRRLFEEGHALGRQLRDASLQERDTLLRQTAHSLGLTGDVAQEAVAAIKDIFELTEMRGGPHGPPPPDGPQPGRMQ